MTHWLRALFLNQIWLKLFSLLLATLLWLAVDTNLGRQSGHRVFDARETTTNFIAQPIHLLTDSGAHGPVVVDPPTVDVAVRGEVSKIAQLDPLDIRAFARIPDRPDFEGTVPVYVQLPRDATLIMVSPAIVRVRPSPPPQAPSPK